MATTARGQQKARRHEKLLAETSDHLANNSRQLRDSSLLRCEYELPMVPNPRLVQERVEVRIERDNNQLIKSGMV